MSRIFIALLLGILLMPLWGIAQTASPASQQPAAAIGAAKIAWLSLEQVIYSCDEGKREFGEVQKFVEKKQAEMDGLRKESETLKNQLNVQGSKLTDEARADIEDRIDAKDTAIQRFQQDTQKEIESRRVKATNYVGRRMLPVLEKIAKEKGLSAIVYLNPSRDAWVDPALIITEEVIKAYNQAYPATAEKPAAQAAPAKK
jgi:Skp family chaperone for outer membrane proteins